MKFQRFFFVFLYLSTNKTGNLYTIYAYILRKTVEKKEKKSKKVFEYQSKKKGKKRKKKSFFLNGYFLLR